MIAKALSTSRRYGRLHDVAGRRAEFCQALYPLLVAHADDFGRLSGDTYTVKHAVIPTSPRKEHDISAALAALHLVGLIEWYEVEGEKVIEIVNFLEHQKLSRKTPSVFPDSIGSLSASEAEVEAALARDLKSGALRVSDYVVIDVNRQVRKGASYLDIVANTSVGVVLLIEVKRQRVTENAISQVRAYRQLLGGDVVPIVIGHGIAKGLDVNLSDVIVGTYGDDLIVSTANPITVKSRVLTLNHIPAELNRREVKGTEEKERARPRAVAGKKPEYTAWECPHVDRCASRSQCHDMSLIGRPEKQAS